MQQTTESKTTHFGVSRTLPWRPRSQCEIAGVKMLHVQVSFTHFVIPSPTPALLLGSRRLLCATDRLAYARTRHCQFLPAGAPKETL